MRFRYGKWDEQADRRMAMRDLTKLFTHLLTQSSGTWGRR